MGLGALIDAAHKGERTICERTPDLKISLAPVAGRR